MTSGAAFAIRDSRKEIKNRRHLPWTGPMLPVPTTLKTLTCFFRPQRFSTFGARRSKIREFVEHPDTPISHSLARDALVLGVDAIERGICPQRLSQRKGARYAGLIDRLQPKRLQDRLFVFRQGRNLFATTPTVTQLRHRQFPVDTIVLTPSRAFSCPCSCPRRLPCLP
jgi:hypothetical protein